ncbi:conserved Plasmodium protein, unknown function [Plasmodium berghei]|uniref:SAC3 domain-containing protein, putative n=2 Tax=Plasmodium berghei TaxID=5821 RepID=A0A509AGM1_PLABA|nr:SAC3 domain-containing protein, putative [Plasmodium berghei ANKA]CXH79683.1 conserved Plasmodium protein, unknown function [Plasmodium berghei]SCM18969.1 conserved Plasmodium protein, unknown function [Plasmodium berghei]SCN21516.1 conserved Plasmodium protein, unknown function [Plasmodium berghei]SCO58762.1 conserved Plasmodium protein, unknown function [Plasmodium berghei]SCO58784.1 conserved Plasmodium protein, unknown function [Plasmodium berghei]|eukprot:XP_034419614.1 SAC3 domain-containing protein, putative [Plasmodium berghei ANKA]
MHVYMSNLVAGKMNDSNKDRKDDINKNIHYQNKNEAKPLYSNSSNSGVGNTQNSLINSHNFDECNYAQSNYQNKNYYYMNNDNKYYQNVNNNQNKGNYNNYMNTYENNSGNKVNNEQDNKEEQTKSEFPYFMNTNENYVELYINKVKEIYYFHVFYHYLKLGYPEKDAAIESKKYIFITLNRYFLLVKNAILSSPESIKQINNCVSSNLLYYQQQTNLQEFLLHQQASLQNGNLQKLNLYDQMNLNNLGNLSSIGISNINLPLANNENLSDLSKISNSENISGRNDVIGNIATSIRGGNVNSSNNNSRGNNFLDKNNAYGYDSNNSKENKSIYNNNYYNLKADKINNMIDSIEEMKKLNKNINDKKKNDYNFASEQMSNFQNNFSGSGSTSYINKNENMAGFGNNNDDKKKKISFSLNKSKNKIFQSFNNSYNDTNHRKKLSDAMSEVSDLSDENKGGSAGNNNTGGNMSVINNSGLYGFNSIQNANYSQHNTNIGINKGGLYNLKGNNNIDGKNKMNYDSFYGNINNYNYNANYNNNENRNNNFPAGNTIKYGIKGGEQENNYGLNNKGINKNLETNNNMHGTQYNNVFSMDYGTNNENITNDLRTGCLYNVNRIKNRGNEKDNFMYDNNKLNKNSDYKMCEENYNFEKSGNDYNSDKSEYDGGEMISNNDNLSGYGKSVSNNNNSKLNNLEFFQNSSEITNKSDSFKTYINTLNEHFREHCKNKEFFKSLKFFINKLFALKKKKLLKSTLWVNNILPTKEEVIALDMQFYLINKRSKRKIGNNIDMDIDLVGLNLNDKKLKLSLEEIEKREKRKERCFDIGKSKKKELGGGNPFYLDIYGETGSEEYRNLEILIEKYNYSSCYKNKNFVGECKNIQKFFFRLTSLPEKKNVRSFSVLKCTYAYILYKYNIDKNYKYVNEQFRSMRQDLNIQNIFHHDVINIYETNIRICIVNNDLFQFLQCINKLFELYQRLNIKKSKVEFLCYKLIYLTLQNMHQEFIIEYLTLSEEEKHNSNIQLCYYLNECIKNKMYLININMISPLNETENHEYIYYRVFVNNHILAYLPTLMSINENADLNVNIDSLSAFVNEHSDPSRLENIQNDVAMTDDNAIKMPYLTNYLIVLFLPKYRLLALINICKTSIKVNISTLTKLLNFENDHECLKFLNEVNTIINNNEVLSKPSLVNLLKSPLLKNKYINHIR